MTEHSSAHTLPFGYRVTFHWRDAHMRVEWEPDFPRIKKQRAFKRFLAAYQAARKDFMTDVSAMSGLSIGIADTNGDFDIVTPPVKQ